MKPLFIIFLALTFASCLALPSSRNILLPAGGPTGRVVNGHNATTGQFPYQVGLALDDSPKASHWCGGSIINNEWILTAAHCTEGVIGATIYLGTTVRKAGEVIYQVPAENIITHEKFDGDGYENDIAVIKMPFTNYTDIIQPIQLPAMGKSFTKYAGDIAIASGWGKNRDDAEQLPDQLQWARLGVVPNGVCEKTLGKLQSSHICTATENGVNICTGDSGGPLVLESSKVQIGLTSFSWEVCADSIPGVYTRVTSFLDWIKDKTGVSY